MGYISKHIQQRKSSSGLKQVNTFWTAIIFFSEFFFSSYKNTLNNTGHSQGYVMASKTAH